MLRITELLNDGVEVVIEINADDLTFRHHDVIDGNLIQVQHAQHHILRLGCDFCAIKDQGPEFVTAQMVILCGQMIDSKNAQ